MPEYIYTYMVFLVKYSYNTSRRVDPNICRLFR